MIETDKPQSDPAADAPSTATAETPAEEPAPPPEPMTPERVSLWNRYYDWYVVLSVLVLTFVVSSNKITHSSIWSQLQVGRLILSRGEPVTTDLFSYTEAGRRWVNIPWLFDVLHAFLYRVAADLVPVNQLDPAGSSARAEQYGAGTLVALNALVRLVTALLLLSIRRAGPGRWWSAVCVFLALGAVISPAPSGFGSASGLAGMVILGGLAAPGSVTPGTWGLMMLALELLLLHKATDSGRKGAAYALPFVFALWANLDESFLIGLVLLAAAVVGRARPARDEPPTALGLKAGLVVLALSAAACLVNPSLFGVFGAAVEPFLALFRGVGDSPTIDQLSIFSATLRKNPASWTTLVVTYLILVSIGLGSFYLNRARFSPGRFLTFVAASLLWLALLRYGPEFVAVLVTTLVLNGQEWYHDSFGTEGRLGTGWSVWSVGGRAVTLLVVSLCVMKALTGFGGAGEAQFGFGFDPDDFAFEAASFLKTAPIEGNVLNTSAAQGDALISRAYPGRKTFTDGRRNLFPASLMEELRVARQALSKDEEETWKPFLDKYKISAVMLGVSSSQPNASPETYKTLMRSLNWIPFHDDGNTVIFGRADAPAADLAYFKANALDPDRLAYRTTRPTPPPDRLPSPVSWYDTVFQNRAQARPQPHSEASRRWLIGSSLDGVEAGNTPLPSPARCLLAIQEARAALASKPDDTQAFRLLAAAYGDLLRQESALLAGIALTPENARKIAEAPMRPEILMTRFRQRVTALVAAIQTTPPPQTREARRELSLLNLELFQAYLSLNYLDLARDHLAAVLDASAPGDFTPEQRVLFSQDLAKLTEEVKAVQEKKAQLELEEQPNPADLANRVIANGMPGLAIQILEEAERTGTTPALVKPLLLDLYCNTGQPDKAVEVIGGSTTKGDSNFGTDPGIAQMRQGRAYFLWGNYEYASTLWERDSIRDLRLERTQRALMGTQSLLKGEAAATTSSLLEIPEKIANQAAWEFDDALCRLEGGLPDLAAEHFAKSLTLVPRLSLRPVITYYLQKLGKPVPPEDPSAVPKAPAGGEKPKEETKSETPR